MPTAKELREKRKPIADAISQMANAGTAVDASGNYTEAWTKANADYNALTRQIEIAETSERITAEQGPLTDWRSQIGRGDLDGRTSRELPAGDGASAAVTEQHRALALKAWLSCQYGAFLDERSQEACRAVRLNPYCSTLDIPLFSTDAANTLQRRFRSVHSDRAVDHVSDFRATMSIGSGPSGGYLIAPETLTRTLEVNMLYFGGVRQVADQIRTTTGERLSWPTVDDTSNTGAQLGESTSIGSSVDPSLGKGYWDAYKFSSKPILIPHELIEDSAFNLPELIGQMFGERLGRITNTKFTTGSGAATCKGIVTAATSFAAASATAITYDDILGLTHAIDPAYRNGASFMLNDAILLVLRKLKDGSGRPLWESNIQVGMPDRLDGKPLTLNQDMDSTVASGKKTILYGQMNKYKVRTVGNVRMYRLQERYRDTDQDGFVALIREDGNLLTAGTAPVKYLSH